MLARHFLAFAPKSDVTALVLNIVLAAQGVTVPAAALRPLAASGESDAGALPSSRSYPASDSPLNAGTTTPSAFSGPLDSPPVSFCRPFENQTLY
jgi:hypothetical protein